MGRAKGRPARETNHRGLKPVLGPKRVDQELETRARLTVTHRGAGDGSGGVAEAIASATLCSISFWPRGSGAGKRKP